MRTSANELFVGRARELWELERALSAAQAASGATVLVSGEAGIGKTRLAAELAARAGAAGFDVLLGRSIDFVGTELPYLPFVEALRPLGALREARSQLRVFEETLALLARRTAAAPVLLVLEDVHWADTSTLDLVVYLAHNVGDRRLLVLATYRPDEHPSTGRMCRLADGVRRSNAALLLELGPLERDDLIALVGGRAPAALASEIVARSEGNPFFAEELVAAAGENGRLPPGLRDLLLRRVARLDERTRSLLRLASAAGRDVGYPLLRATAALPEPEVRESLRRAVDHGVLVADQSAGSFRFRHALLAEAIYATILPGEREELHARLADELARTGAASSAELAPHWTAAGRAAEALHTSVEAARQAAAVFGLAEAHGHLERALAVWDAVPDAAALAGVDLTELCAWAAGLASDVGAAPRAVELARRSIELVGAGAPHRAAFLTVRLGEYLYEVGRNDEALAALERAVALAPAEPPSPERAYALSSLAGGLMVARRNAESLPLAEQALALARAVGANEAEVRALTVLAGDLVYLGRGDAGLARYREVLQLAEEVGDHVGLARVYINFTDALTMLGRNREAAQLAETGLEVMRRHGVDSTLIVANRIEALLEIGDWDAADRESAAAVRGITESFPDARLILRALLETGRGEFDAAHAHFDAASNTTRPDRGHGLLDGWIAELALWERRWEDAEAAVEEGLAQARGPGAAHIRVFVSATGLRAQAELAALARARRDTDDLHDRLDRARKLLATARRAAASSITPTSTGWLAQADAEHERALGAARPELWRAASETWDRLDRSPLAAYCRWRQAEALVGAGASRAEASAPLRDAHAVATRLAAKPLLAELELLAQRARLELAAPEAAAHVEQQRVEEALGLTHREAEVLALVARGYTNREIAGELVISVKTASVHVSHILRKLGAPSRQEAAAISHRFAPTIAQPREFER